MKNYTSYLFERKQLGELYHLVDINKLNYILNTNTIKSYKFSNISLTRNKMLNYYLGDVSTTIFKLVIDADKLSDKYKIKPFRYKSQTNIWFSEYEESVITNKIDNAFNYIKKIVLIKEKVEELKKSIFDELDVSDWFTTIGGYDGNLPKLIKEIQISLKEKYNQDIYIQDNTKIIKDDDYLNYIINYPLKEINTKIFIAYRGTVKGEREYSIKDYLVDSDGNILSNELIIGETIKLSKNIKNIKNAKNLYKKEFEKKFFKQFSEPDIKYYNNYGWFKPYLIYVRELNNGKWKLDNIHPLKIKQSNIDY